MCHHHQQSEHVALGHTNIPNHLGPSLQVDAVAFGAFLPLAWDSFWVVLTDNL